MILTLIDIETSIQLEKALKSINHPIRFRIINIISDNGNNATVRHVLDKIGIVDYLIKPHIYRLRNDGILKRKPPIKNQEHIYQVDKNYLALVMDSVKKFGNHK